MVPDWNAVLNSALPEEGFRDIRRNARTGRPLGDETFLGRLEEMAGRVLEPQKPGPKPKPSAEYVMLPPNSTLYPPAAVDWTRFGVWRR